MELSLLFGNKEKTLNDINAATEYKCLRLHSQYNLVLWIQALEGFNTL